MLMPKSIFLRLINTCHVFTVFYCFVNLTNFYISIYLKVVEEANNFYFKYILVIGVKSRCEVNFYFPELLIYFISINFRAYW